MLVNFNKMQGAGNDFIIINGFDYNLPQPVELANKLCNRHFGIGADGLIIILPAEDKQNDFKMRIFNTDGSEAEMCGNGIRCFAHYVREKSLTDKNKIFVETLAGIITPEITEFQNKTSSVRVNMGKPGFKSSDIPVRLEKDIEYIKDYPLIIDDQKYEINCVSMGNPHAIIFTDNPDKYPLQKWGSKIETHHLFPEKTNVEFIKILNPGEIIMKVWERGSGITLACGTGATASVIAGIKNGLLDNKVLVHLPGGDLVIEWSGEEAYMTGPAEFVYTGEIEI